MSDEAAAGTAVVQEHPEVTAIRQAGGVAVSRQRELNNITRQLAGLKWGDISGQSLSTETRYAIAQMCQLTGMNPLIHLDILGGKVYPNATFYQERMQSDPCHIAYEEKNISSMHEAELRKLADEAAADGDEQEAVLFRRQARECARLRSHYGVPEWATHAFEGTAVRYSEGAPLAPIMAGRIDPTPFVQRISAANWAGNKPQMKKRDGSTYEADPIGNLEPGKTASTRTMRRVGKRAYPSFLNREQEEALQKLEAAVEAEFTVISSDIRQERAALPSPTGEQAVRIGAGEPEAAAPKEEAKPLPVQEVGTRVVPANARKEKEKFEAGCKALGVEDLPTFYQDVLGHVPTTLADFQKLNTALAGIADGGDEQQSLV